MNIFASVEKFALLHICTLTNEKTSRVKNELICSFPHCVCQFHPVTDGEETEMCGGLGPDWWWGMILVVWSRCSSKHNQRGDKKPQNNQLVSHSSTLRENSKWSRLRYYPAFTTPTVWGNLYDESWKGYFFPLPCSPPTPCLCLFSLHHFFNVILNELLCAPLNFLHSLSLFQRT